ncbi:MAG: type II secretion system F family protein [Alphaproteobacteria bacterium]|nr:type II secretion system F family protein [Alphaproteobacteria bacterium]
MEIGGLELTEETLVVVAASIAVFVILVIVWKSLLEPKPESNRLKDLKARREQLREGLLASTGKVGNSEVAASSMSFMRKVVGRANILKGDVAKDVGDKLARAGLRTKDAMVAYTFFKGALPFVGGAVGLIVINMFAPEDMAYIQRVFSALIVSVLMFFVPDLYIRQLSKKRQKLLQKGLPDALDLLVVCAQAGLSLDSAIGRVAKEVAFSSPTVGEELSLTALELGFLPERKAALENLKSRTGLKDIASVCTTLVQSEKYGTPLAYALKVLSAEFRRERMMRAEEKAAQLPAIMTLPLALFILPVLFMVIIGPAIITATASFSNSKLPGQGG